MANTIPRQSAINAIAALKFNDARTPTELSHNAALSEAIAALCAMPCAERPGQESPTVG